MPPKIKLTEEKIKRLIAEKERTGVGFDALLSGKRHEVPQGLNSAIITSWAREKTHSARQAHLDYVFLKYKALPDNPWISITNEQRAIINRVNLKMSGKVLTMVRRHPPPNGVNYQMIKRILAGPPKKLRKAYWDYIQTLNTL